jgi:hypothetical protein
MKKFVKVTKLKALCNSELNTVNGGYEFYKRGVVPLYGIEPIYQKVVPLYGVIPG